MRKTFKHVLALALVSAMLLGMTITANAAQSVTVTLDGQVIETGAYIDGSDRTQAPAEIGEALGMTVSVAGEAVTYSKDGVSVKFEGTKAGDVAMDTTVVAGYVPVSYLAAAFGYGVKWDGAAKTVALTSPVVEQKALTVDDIKSIQAYTDETMYGTGLVEVVVTYADGADLSGITAASYILEDRGTLNPDFGQVAIASAKVSGQTVTLTINNDTGATERNSLVYTGANAGVRERNAFGIYCTGAWYRDVNGTIHYGKEASGEYVANETGMGYQARASLELKLRHADEDASAALALADSKGQYTSANKWLKTIDRQFGEGGFKSFAEMGIQIPSTSAAATDGTGDAYVRGFAYVPANYDPANGIVFTLQGQGICYWQLPDGTNDEGTTIMYDSATTSWKNSGAIVVNISDRSTAGPGEYYEVYDFVVDDCNVMQYFIDTYGVTGNVVIQGNSRGTMASSIIIKALAGQNYSPKEQGMGYQGEHDKNLNGAYDFTIDVFVCQNGSFGGNGIYVQEDYEAVAKTGLKVWCFNGEQDTNDIETLENYRKAIATVGAEIDEDDLRLTGYTSKLYAYWGESDHSTTRINGWYFDEAAYYGPDLEVVNGKIVYNTKLSDGDTYTLECLGSAAATSKNGHEYTVYDELFHEWALKH